MYLLTYVLLSYTMGPDGNWSQNNSNCTSKYSSCTTTTYYYTSLCRCTYITCENESKLFVSKAELANTSQIKIYIKKVSGFFFILKTFTQLSKNFEYKHFKAYLVVHTYNYVNKLNGPPCK